MKKKVVQIMLEVVIFVIIIPLAMSLGFTSDLDLITIAFSPDGFLAFYGVILGLMQIARLTSRAISRENDIKRSEQEAKDKENKKNEINYRLDYLINKTSEFYRYCSLRKFKEIFSDAYSSWQEEPEKFYIMLEKKRSVLAIRSLFNGYEKKIIQEELDNITKFSEDAEISLTKMYRCLVEIKATKQAIESSRNLIAQFSNVVNISYNNAKDLFMYDAIKGYQPNPEEAKEKQVDLEKYKIEMDLLFTELKERQKILNNTNDELVALHSVILALEAESELMLVNSFSNLQKKLEKYYQSEIESLYQ